jgi:hypothetical protein
MAETTYIGKHRIEPPAIHIGNFGADFSNLHDFFQRKYSTKSKIAPATNTNALSFGRTNSGCIAETRIRKGVTNEWRSGAPPFGIALPEAKRTFARTLIIFKRRKNCANPLNSFASSPSPSLQPFFRPINCSWLRLGRGVESGRCKGRSNGRQTIHQVPD